jgi:septum site-determining protein MinD
MAKVVVVTSGKRGLGKTTSAAALGTALAQSGQIVAVVDFDVGLCNLDLVMGTERRVVYDLINVAQGDTQLHQALIRDQQLANLFFLAGYMGLNIPTDKKGLLGRLFGRRAA